MLGSISAASDEDEEKIVVEDDGEDFLHLPERGEP